MEARTKGTITEYWPAFSPINFFFHVKARIGATYDALGRKALA